MHCCLFPVCGYDILQSLPTMSFLLWWDILWNSEKETTKTTAELTAATTTTTIKILLSVLACLALWYICKKMVEFSFDINYYFGQSPVAYEEIETFLHYFFYVFSILLLSLSSQSISIVYKNTKPFPEKWVFSVLKVCFILFLIIKKIFIYKHFWPYSCSPSSLSKYLLNPYPKF